MAGGNTVYAYIISVIGLTIKQNRKWNSTLEKLFKTWTSEKNNGLLYKL